MGDCANCVRDWATGRSEVDDAGNLDKLYCTKLNTMMKPTSHRTKTTVSLNDLP